MKDRERYVTDNGLTMVKCKPLCFQEESMFASGNGPKTYSISVGSMSDMWVCYYDPTANVLMISKFGESSDGPLSFKVNSLEEASEWIKRFADGMKVDLRETIFTYHTHSKGKYLIGDRSKPTPRHKLASAIRDGYSQYDEYHHDDELYDDLDGLFDSV